MAHPAETTLRPLSSGVRSVRPACEAWASRLRPSFGRGSKLRPEAAGSLPGEEAPVREGVLCAVDKVLIKKKNTHKATIASLYHKKKKVGLDSCQDNSCVPIPSTIGHFVRCTNHDVGSFVLLPFAISRCGRVTVGLFVCVPWNQTLFFVPLF